MGTGEMSSLNQSTYTTLDPWHLPWERIKPKRTIKQRQPKALPLATLFHVGCQAMAYYFVAYRQRGVRASSEILIGVAPKMRSALPQGTGIGTLLLTSSHATLGTPY